MIKIPLIPYQFRKFMRMVKRIGILFTLAVSVIWLSMWLSGAFENLTAGVIYLVLFLAVAFYITVPGFRYDKLCRTTAVIELDCLRMLDHRGRCWRKIPFEAITDVRVEELHGFFYGKDNARFHDTYLFIFLNGEGKVPEVPYKKMFRQKNFFPIAYCAEGEDYLSRCLRLYEMQEHQ